MGRDIKIGMECELVVSQVEVGKKVQGERKGKMEGYGEKTKRMTG